MQRYNLIDLEELRKSAIKLEDRACNLKLACQEKSKIMIIHYVHEIAFWSNAVLRDYFDIEKEIIKEV